VDFLLDTNILLWWYRDQKKLSRKMQKVLENPYNDIYFSALNLWEIPQKYQRGKLDLGGRTPEEFLDVIEVDQGFKRLDLLPGTTATSYQLPVRHKDPFDRMIAWEAIQHDYILLSSDESMRLYEQDGLRLYS
jgi:PIN domain nuclease of toxin-antitoxin system